MAKQALRQETPSHSFRFAFYLEFTAVRNGLEHTESRGLSDSPGPFRRFPSTHIPVHTSRNFSAVAAWYGNGHFRNRDHVRADHRALSGRVDYRQLVMALDLLHKYPGGHHLHPDDYSLYCRPRVYTGHKDEDRLLGPHISQRRHRLPTDHIG